MERDSTKVANAFASVAPCSVVHRQRCRATKLNVRGAKQKPRALYIGAQRNVCARPRKENRVQMRVSTYVATREIFFTDFEKKFKTKRLCARPFSSLHWRGLERAIENHDINARVHPPRRYWHSARSHRRTGHPLLRCHIERPVHQSYGSVDTTR